MHRGLPCFVTLRLACRECGKHVEQAPAELIFDEGDDESELGGDKCGEDNE